MAPSFGSAWRSFWHTMTSNDRHASHDSPYRTGQHAPLPQSRHAPLTSIATSALESRPDVTSPYEDETPVSAKRPMSATTNGFSSPGVQSPIRPYSPGMRTNSSHNLHSAEHDVNPGEIQMQSFQEGAPPPPPVAHSWKKIDRWAESKYEELYDQLGEGCTQNDVNELEHDLDCSLPMEVRESLQIHDGQERGGRPTGIIFGCMLLDCEEIVQEWKNWRVVNEEYLHTQPGPAPQPLPKAFGGSSSTAAAQPQNPLWRQELLDKQESQPPKAIQKSYAHPSWIPLARDWGGNNIAVDLAPGPMGKWGQVIIFGRDYDCKYVVARSWAAFLAIVADDMCSEKVIVDEESGELKLKEFKTQSVEPGYLDILRWRTDQKYGRKGPKRKPMGGLGLNTNVKLGRESPYTSPIDSDRGRSPQRFPIRGPTASPKAGFGVSSPLARVTEESSFPLIIHTKNIDQVQGKPEKLVEAPTPQIETAPKSKSTESDNKENGAMKGLGVGGVDGMNSVEI